MNKVFKTFFSKKLNRIVIASERSKAVGKSSSKTNTVIFTALLFQAPIALAYSDGIETGVSNIAIGESALTTGKSSIALGTGAIAIGSNLSLEQLNELLNQQKSLVSDISSIRTDISSKESSYSALLDTVYKVERNLNIIKDLDQSLSSEQSKTNDLSNDWNSTNLEFKEKSNLVSEKLKILNSIDLSKITPTWQEDGGLDGLASQLMTSVENGTNISFGLDFYKDYITKYINVEKNINYDANKYDAVAGNPNDSYYGGIVAQGHNSNEKVIRFNTPLTTVEMQYYMIIDANAYYSESAFDYIVTKQNQHLQDFQNNFDSKIANLKQSDEILDSLFTDEYVTKLKTDIQTQFDTNARTIRKLELDKILRNQTETDPTFATLFKERQDLINLGVGSTTLDNITKDYIDLRTNYKNDRLTSIQQENALNVNKIKDALNSELSDVKSRMESIDLKLKNNKALIADYEKEIANRQPTPEELEAYNKAKLVAAELEAEKKKLSEREQALKDVQGDLADGQNATAMGTDAIATGQNSQAFGTRASALGQDTIAFGTDAKAQKTGSIAIGANSEANAQENDVAIGKGSKTALVVQTSKSMIDGNEYSFAGSTPASTFSIGSVGNERTLTNLAAGQVNGSSTDAVNGSQLFSVITALESNSSLDQLNLKYSDLDKNHVNLAGSDGTTLSNLKDGEISLNSKDAINGGQLFNVNDKLETNINIVSGIQTDITNIQNSDLKSVKYNTDNSAIILTGLNGTKISNLDDGVSDTDAVNLRQLNNVDQKVEGFNSNLTTQITNTNTLIGTTKDQLNTQIIDTNTRIDTTKDQLNTQIIDTNTRIDTTKDQLNTQIINTNTLIGTTKDQLNTQITDTNTRIDTTKDQLAAQIDTTRNELVNTGLNFVSNTGQVVNRKLGQQLSIVGGADVDESLSSAENVITRSTDNGIKIELLKDVKFDTANIGGNILNQQGLFITQGPSITVDGINAGTKKITNVANGEASTDAVNVSQLSNVDQKVEDFNSNLTTQITNTNTLIGTTKDQLNTQITNTNTLIETTKDQLNTQITDTNTLIGTTKDQLNTQITNTNTLIGTTKDQLNTQITDTNTRIDTTKDQLAAQIDTTKNELVNTGLNFVSNTGQVVNRKLGQQLNIVGGANVDESLSSAENVITRSTANGIKIELLKDVKFDTANIGGNILNQQGLFITKGPSITIDGINAGSKKITNVANGEAPTDAVNKGQLDDLITNQNTIDVSAVKYDSSAKDSISLQGKDGTTISNLKDGVSDTDAVNVRQLSNVDQKVESFNSNLTTQINNTNTLISTTKDQLNTQIIDTNNRIDTTKDQLNTQIIDTNTLIGTTKDQLNTQITDTNTLIGTTKDQLNTQIIDTNTLIGTTKDQLNTQITNTNTRIDTTKDQLAAQIDTTKNELVNTGLNFVSNTGQVVNRKLGQQLNIVGGANVDESLSSAENVITRSTANGIKIELLKDVKFDSLNFGGNILNQQGLFITKGPSITVDGINAGSKKITNVANGEASTDAVNKGQLDDLIASQNAIDVSTVKYDSSTKDSISLQGKDGTTISNLKDGVSDTDAVNVRQLSNVDQKVEGVNSNLTSQIADTNTRIDTTKNELVNTGLNFVSNTGQVVNRKLGQQLSIVGGADVDESLSSAENVITRSTDNGIKIELLKDVKFDTANIGGNILNQQGLFITKGPSITINGINSGGKQIINLADGVNANDAVNKGQLDKLKDEVSQEIAKIPSIENVVKYDQAEKDSITLGGEIGTNIKNVADGAIEEGSKDAINGNQLWGVQQQVNKNTGDIKNIQNNIENITNGKSGLVQQESPNAKITVGNGTGGKSVDISGTEGDRTIDGVKSGSISANSNQAVNGSQLHQTNQKVETNSNEINKLKDSDKTSVKYDSDMSNIVLAGNNGTAIKNVQNGNISSSSKDAINGSQLYQAKQDVLRDANAYTDNRFSEYDQKFNKYNKKANSGIAAALAMASIGQPTDIGYSMVSISTGAWEGESSIAIGTSGVTEDSNLFGIKGNYIWKFAGTSDSVGNIGGGASLNFQWK